MIIPPIRLNRKASEAHYLLYKQRKKQTWYLSLISLILSVEKKLSCGEISAFHVWQLWENWQFHQTWRNFRCLHMRKINNVYNWWGFIAIYAVLLLNLLFTLFCREIYFATIYALSCGEKLSPKVHLWRKNDKYQVCNLHRCTAIFR